MKIVDEIAKNMDRFEVYIPEHTAKCLETMAHARNIRKETMATLAIECYLQEASSGHKFQVDSVMSCIVLAAEKKETPHEK